MALRRTPRKRDSQLAFDALSIEGGLLSPEWLARVAQLAAGQQSEADYRIPKGLNLRDEIGRYWRIAQAHWHEFAEGLTQLEAKAHETSDADARALAERFVLALLRECFGFTSLAPVAPVALAGRRYPIGFAAVSGRVPVVVTAAASGLDAPLAVFGDEGRKRSAFGVSQEFLNAEERATWGLVSDGVMFRVLRDNASLTRPAWIEADLRRIFTEERYADFAALWLLTHETRFGRATTDGSAQAVTACALDVWREAGREQGVRAREHLRRGVEEALLALGQGFLSHPENGALRTALQDGSLTKTAYFQELLRLAYRLIFLITVEERGLLHGSDASEEARRLYADGYSLRRLRDRAARRSAHDRFADLWEATKIVFRALVAGEQRLGLPALAGIFARTQCPSLDAAKLENRALLLAVFRLAWLREKSGLARVNWRDMGPEELGSVYESLLELVPQVTEDGRGFAFAAGGETKGNARKTSGSYYTPDSLVQVLLDTALEPVVKQTIAAHPARPADALLRLSIVDPACGSGHFLLAAARRVAAHLARVQSDGTPSAAEYRRALRQVVGRCVYGVDLNPMAVELCKVSLWMEAVEPGLPLTFLDSHIRGGNALLGATPELMATGVPDAAWEPIEGDDRKTASALKKRNRLAAAGQRGLNSLWSEAPQQEASQVAQAVAELEAAPDADAWALAQKESRWEGILGSAAYRHQKFVADAWCAAFVWPKQPGPFAEAAPTNELWRQIRDGQGQPPALTVEATGELASQYRFFHWHLDFPQVFAHGGFDVVLGNPPWERVKLQEQEFFASRSSDIADAPNAAARKKLITALPGIDAVLWAEWCAASRAAEGQSQFVRQSGRYPLCGKGDINTYAIFAEHNVSVLAAQGRAGFIAPSGIATDDTTKEYFESLASTSRLAALFHFENEENVFPGVHHAFRFVLLVIDRSGQSATADLVFYARQVAELVDPSRHVSLASTDFATLNPNTRTCPTFRSRRDADINLGIYRRVGVLWREEEAGGNRWGLRFMTMFHMANDSVLFRSPDRLEATGHKLVRNCYQGPEGLFVPLIEAKMIHHFDHRFGTYEGQGQGQANQGKLPELDDGAHADPNRVTLPEYWVAAHEVDERLKGQWNRQWLLGWRNICRSTDRRTVIASLMPKAAVGHATPLMFTSVEPSLVAMLYANLCCFALDYTARQKVGGANLTYGYLKQFPVLAPSAYAADSPWSTGTNLRDWFLPRVLELTFTAWDLEPFAKDVHHDGPPFRWDSVRRVLLRAELDAAFFHLYGLSRDDTAHVMDTFPIVRKNDERAFREFRTKRVILEIFDAMSDAVRAGSAYETRLDPPPADSRVAHPDTRGTR